MCYKKVVKFTSDSFSSFFKSIFPNTFILLLFLFNHRGLHKMNKIKVTNPIVELDGDGGRVAQGRRPRVVHLHLEGEHRVDLVIQGCGVDDHDLAGGRVEAGERRSIPGVR